MFDILIIILILLGMGVFTGAYGVGSALFTIPCLLTLFSYFHIIPEEERYKFAQGGAFIIMIITSVWIVRKYYEHIDWKMFRIFCIPTVLGITLGFEIMNHLKIKDMERLFSIYLFAIAAFIVYQWVIGRKVNLKRKKTSKLFIMTAGFMVGVKVGIFGPGGETLVVPIMRTFNKSIKRSIATMSLLSLIVGVFGIILFYCVGIMRLGIYTVTVYTIKDIVCVIIIVILAYFVIKFGVIIHKKLSERALLLLYALVLCIIALYLLH